MKTYLLLLAVLCSGCTEGFRKSQPGDESFLFGALLLNSAIMNQQMNYQGAQIQTTHCYPDGAGGTTCMTF